MKEFLKERNNLSWNYMLIRACCYGRKDFCLYTIKQGANDWNIGLKLACFFGHRDIALLMIEQGVQSIKTDRKLRKFLIIMHYLQGIILSY